MYEAVLYAHVINQFFTSSLLIPGDKPVSYFCLFEGGKRIPYNAGNTVKFSNAAQNLLKVSMLFQTLLIISARFEPWSF